MVIPIKIPVSSPQYSRVYNYLIYNIHYSLSPKHLGTNSLVIPIFVFGQDNPDVQHSFLAYLRLPTPTCRIHNILGTDRLHMEEAFALHIEYILPSHHAVFLRIFLFPYLLFIIYNIYFFAPQTSLIYRSDANQNTNIFSPIFKYLIPEFVTQLLRLSLIPIIRREVR
nr:MAG TPA: hypothetical protein [Caudoviricetes sp.]